MLKGENIVCISSIDWDFNWQGHQELMSRFARQGNRVLYIENTGLRTIRWSDLPRLNRRFRNWRHGIQGIRKTEENLYVYSPILLPFPFSRWARWINRSILFNVLGRWMKSVNFYNPIVWSFLPTPLTLELIRFLNGHLSIYYCIADFAPLSNHPTLIRKSEQKLLRRCDIVFAQGERLKRYCEQFHKQPVEIFPFGVDEQLFQNDGWEVPEDLKDIPRPLIGYCGGVHRHINFSLITQLAERHPDWSFVIVGPLQTEATSLTQYPNIHLLGRKIHTSLPAYIDCFDVCLIPYQLSDYTQTVYPTKLNEYLILGKPVVSTGLQEIHYFNDRYEGVVEVGEDSVDFSRHIQRFLEEEGAEAEEKRRRRIEAALTNSWSRRIETMSSIIRERREAKWHQTENSWDRLFKGSLRRSFRQLSVTVLGAVLSIGLLFYSPVIWWLASPLRIEETPRRVDAIVVLGAGVGETGSPGKSTLERARYGAELFHKGFAPYLIFSSGYIYTYQEAEDMKLVATSLGVPPAAIILETDSASTYESVRNVKEILEKKRWHSILLVSAPYHMRRVASVFQKSGGDIQTVYIPLPRSDFYSRGRRVKWEQICALSHEAFGILYYWWKGYL